MVKDFDIAAATYDQEFTQSSIGKAQRARVYHYLHKWLAGKQGLNILEVNCGTGADAVHLSQMGHRVTATDASLAMLEQARIKTTTKDIRLLQLDLKALDDPRLEKDYDLIFSNFGGLNCLSAEQLGLFLEQAERSLSANGELILVLMSRSCALERIYYRLKGDREKAYRRAGGGPLMVAVNGLYVNTWYYNPKDLQALLPAGLSIQKAYPVGISIPPSYMQKGINRKPWLLKLGAWLEPLIAIPPLASMGDHYILKIVRQ